MSSGLFGSLRRSSASYLLSGLAAYWAALALSLDWAVVWRVGGGFELLLEGLGDYFGGC